MITRFTRYPGGKILGFGTPIQMQKRNVWNSDDMFNAVVFGTASLAILSTTALYLTYRSYKYFHNNYEIVRKNKTVETSTHSNEKNISENQQPIRRPGGMGSSGE
jgi:hypothetical protein